MRKIIKPLLIISILLLIACKKEKTIHFLTKQDKLMMIEFANKLIASINNYEYDLIKKAWDNEIFKNRVVLKQNDLMLFNYAFKDHIANNNEFQIIEIVNDLKYKKGKAYLTKIDEFNDHMEIILTMVFENKTIEFLKYRIEKIENSLKITDYYSFKFGLWQSENIKNYIELSTKYPATSNDRMKTNLSYLASIDALKNMDTILALDFLNEIPESHSLGINLCLKKINIAYSLNDSIYSSVLDSAYKKNNKNLYIRYLYGSAYDDTLMKNNTFKELRTLTGKNNRFVDSIIKMSYMWY